MSDLSLKFTAEKSTEGRVLLLFLPGALPKRDMKVNNLRWTKMSKSAWYCQENSVLDSVGGTLEPIKHCSKCNRSLFRSQCWMRLFFGIFKQRASSDRSSCLFETQERISVLIQELYWRQLINLSCRWSLCPSVTARQINLL